MTVTPLFLFSLPRAGSTLVQRVLASDPRIATTSEPWILLPLLSTYADTEVYAEYVHRAAKAAISDFSATLPGGLTQYQRELRELVIRLYSAQSGDGVRYFLDKTPRYHLVVRHVMDLFPDAKFVFLWRNPLAVAASMIESFSKGRWTIYQFKVDLYKGLWNLMDTYRERAGSAIAVKYEDLVSGDAQAWKPLFDYLGLSFDPSVLSRFAEVKITGRMKDFTGIARHKTITDSSVRRWTQTFRHPVRKRWARQYLRALGRERLALMGYSMSDLSAELDRTGWTASALLQDLARQAFGLLYVWTEPGIFRAKLGMLPHTTRVLKHG